MSGVEIAHIAAFLLARYAEEEELAHPAAGATAWRADHPAESYVLSRAGERLFTVELEDQLRADPSTLALAAFFAATLPGKVLTQIETNRRTVQRCVDEVDAGTAGDGQLMTSGAQLADDILRDLASAHADHPDYRQEWKP